MPEEFRVGIVSNNVDIVDFFFSERRIEGAAPADIAKARHIRCYLLQVVVMTDEPAKLSNNPETSRQITFMVPGGECVCIRHDTLLGETLPRSTVATKSALE